MTNWNRLTKAELVKELEARDEMSIEARAVDDVVRALKPLTLPHRDPAGTYRSGGEDRGKAIDRVLEHARAVLFNKSLR